MNDVKDRALKKERVKREKRDDDCSKGKEKSRPSKVQDENRVTRSIKKPTVVAKREVVASVDQKPVLPVATGTSATSTIGKMPSVKIPKIMREPLKVQDENRVTRSKKKPSVVAKREVVASVEQKPVLPIATGTNATSTIGKMPSFKIPKIKREPVESSPSPSPASSVGCKGDNDVNSAVDNLNNALHLAACYKMVPAKNYNTANSNYDETVYPLPFPTSKWSSPGICKFWLDGVCSLAAKDCCFEHAGVVVKEWRKCKFHAFKNNCAKAKACSFMHETFPCRAFHLLGESACPRSRPCRLSHDPLDKKTRPLFEEDVQIWRAEVEYDAEEEAVKDNGLVVKITRAMAKLGLQYEDADDHSPKGTNAQTSQEFNYAGYRGPSGKESLRRYVVHGTMGLLSYARDNVDKFDAYEYVDSTLRAFQEDEYRRKREEIEERLALEEDDSAESGYWDWEWEWDDRVKVEPKFHPFSRDEEGGGKAESGGVAVVKCESERATFSSPPKVGAFDDSMLVKVEMAPVVDLDVAPNDACGSVSVAEVKLLRGIDPERKLGSADPSRAEGSGFKMSECGLSDPILIRSH